MDEREVQEIETRLRAALMARTDLVTHQQLRPAVPPNAHTAGLAKGRRRSWAVSWRNFLVPVTVAAALGGGVFAGTQISGKSGSGDDSAHVASGGQPTGATTPNGPAATTPGLPAGVADPTAGFGGLTFHTAGWTLTAVDTTTACLTPPGHTLPKAGQGAAKLPCGVDSITLRTGVGAADWPAAGAKTATGWWPAATADASGGSAAVPCPASTATTDRGAVKTSAVLRTDASFPLSGGLTAAYTDWAVGCADGTGVEPRLWLIGTGSKLTAVSAVPVDVRYEADLLRIVASIAPAA